MFLWNALISFGSFRSYAREFDNLAHFSASAAIACRNRPPSCSESELPGWRGVAAYREHLFPEIVVFDLAVALEGEHSNDRIFDDPYENAMALVRDFDAREKAGGIEAHEHGIENRGVVVSVRPLGESKNGSYRRRSADCR